MERAEKREIAKLYCMFVCLNVFICARRRESPTLNRQIHTYAHTYTFLFAERERQQKENSKFLSEKKRREVPMCVYGCIGSMCARRRG